MSSNSNAVNSRASSAARRAPARSRARARRRARGRRPPPGADPIRARHGSRQHPKQIEPVRAVVPQPFRRRSHGCPAARRARRPDRVRHRNDARGKPPAVVDRQHDPPVASEPGERRRPGRVIRQWLSASTPRTPGAVTIRASSPAWGSGRRAQAHELWRSAGQQLVRGPVRVSRGSRGGSQRAAASWARRIGARRWPRAGIREGDVRARARQTDVRARVVRPAARRSHHPIMGRHVASLQRTAFCSTSRVSAWTLGRRRGRSRTPAERRGRAVELEHSADQRDRWACHRQVTLSARVGSASMLQPVRLGVVDVQRDVPAIGGRTGQRSTSASMPLAPGSPCRGRCARCRAVRRRQRRSGRRPATIAGSISGNARSTISRDLGRAPSMPAEDVVDEDAAPRSSSACTGHRGSGRGRDDDRVELSWWRMLDHVGQQWAISSRLGEHLAGKRRCPRPRPPSCRPSGRPGPGRSSCADEDRSQPRRAGTTRRWSPSCSPITTGRRARARRRRGR